MFGLGIIRFIGVWAMRSACTCACECNCRCCCGIGVVERECARDPPPTGDCDRILLKKDVAGSSWPAFPLLPPFLGVPIG